MSKPTLVQVVQERMGFRAARDLQEGPENFQPGDPVRYRDEPNPIGFLGKDGELSFSSRSGIVIRCFGNGTCEVRWDVGTISEVPSDHLERVQSSHPRQHDRSSLIAARVFPLPTKFTF